MKIEVAQNERVVVLVDQKPSEVLGTGVHKRSTWFRTLSVRRFPLSDIMVTTPDAESLALDPSVKQAFVITRVGDNERALLYKDDNLTQIRSPGVQVMLADAPGYRIDVIRLNDGLELSAELRERVVRLPGHLQYVRVFAVPAGHIGLLFLDNHLQESDVPPGAYAYWIGKQDVRIDAFDLREQTHEIQGQELMTKDKVSLRLNLSTRLQLTDARRAATEHANYKDALYRELQLALRSEIGALTLDELLAKKEELGTAIKERAEKAIATLGVTLIAAGIRDVILPGDMRTIMNQVIEAEKRAAANLITRREETAATRNLMNTAKMLESSPTLMRLKELEAAERIADKIQHLSVYGGLDAFLGMVREKVQ